MGPDAMIFIFWMLRFKPTFSLSIFPFIKRLFSSSSVSAIRVVSSAYLRLLYFSRQSWFQLVSLSCPTLCYIMGCSMPGFPVHHQLLELAQTHVHQVGDATNNFIFCLPLCLLTLIFPCIRVFPNVPVLPIRWPKYWRFSFNIGPSN